MKNAGDLEAEQKRVGARADHPAAAEGSPPCALMSPRGWWASLARAPMCSDCDLESLSP